MTKKLNMIFKTTENKNATLTLADPKDGITRAEVLALMNQIVAKDIFLTSKQIHLASVSDVTIRTTEETTLA